jgi:hypothetical protein
MPVWVPPAIGLLVFWVLVALLLRLVFRRSPAPTEPPLELVFEPRVLDRPTVTSPAAGPEPDATVTVSAAPAAASAPEVQVVPPRPPRRKRERAPVRAFKPLPPVELPDDLRLPFSVRHRRLVAASRRLAERQRSGGSRSS